MSGTDSFIEEVTDELRRDRLFAFFRRWGPLVILMLVGIVAFSAWTEWQKATARAEAEARGDALYSAGAAETPEARLAALRALPPGVASGPVTRLMEASALAEAGKADEARAVLAALRDTPGLDPVWRDAAVLRLIGLDDATMAPADRIAALDPLVGPDSGFRLIALEQRALARIGGGDTSAAIEDLRAILADPGLSASQGTRVAALLQSVGAALDPAVPAQ